MNNSEEKYKRLFLDEEDSNFDELIKSISYIENKLRDTYSSKNSSFNNDLIDVSFSGVIPEIGKDSRTVLTEIIPAFKNLIRWNHSNTLHNITPPSLIDGVAAKTITSLYNPNCIWDYVSGNFISLERAISGQIAELVGFKKGYLGSFTFGGKGTLLYAVRLGINRCDRRSIEDGVSKDIVVITSAANHYSIEYICSLVGIGKKACIRIPVDDDGLINLTLLEEKLQELVKEGKKIACIVLSGGNSLNNVVDPFGDVSLILERLVKKYDMPYRPFLHADSVIGWLWLVYKNYDFSNNPLNIKSSVLKRIRLVLTRISEIHLVDSLGVDFHKNAFASYSSSLFLSRDADELSSLNSVQLLRAVQNEYGNNFLQHRTLEHSRSGDGIISAYVSLQELGIDGFQKYIASMMTLNDYIRQNVDPRHFEVINLKGLGFGVVVFPRPIFYDGAYNQLKIETGACVQNIQAYCQGLFGRISSLKGGGIPVIGYVSNYTKTREGYDLPAFKFYPMSFNTTEESIQKTLDILKESKKKFDGEWDSSSPTKPSPEEIVFPK